jgi:hypothetical protein
MRAAALAPASKVPYATPDPGEVMLKWWKNLLVFIFSREELQAAAGLAVLADSYHFDQAHYVTRGGPVGRGIDGKMFEGLIEVSVLQPDLSTRSGAGDVQYSMQRIGAGVGEQLFERSNSSGAADVQYNMQRLHREAGALLLRPMPRYQESVQRKAAAIGLKVTIYSTTFCMQVHRLGIDAALSSMCWGSSHYLAVQPGCAYSFPQYPIRLLLLLMTCCYCCTCCVCFKYGRCFAAAGLQNIIWCVQHANLVA